MKLQKLINRFNEQDVHLVVSAWPEKHTNHGIAWYTKLVTTAQAKAHDVRFVILAEKNHDNEPKLLENGKILVLRIFDNKRHSLYPTILTWLRHFDKIQNVLIHSEFGINAGMAHYLLLLPFIGLIKLTGRRIIYFAHNVVTDASFLKTHLHIGNIWLLNIAINVHTKCLAALSDHIVVLDDVLKNRLVKLVGPNKVILSPIPVEPKKLPLTQAQAKQKLGLNGTVILDFGFISPYKGTDWLVETFPNKNDVHLVIAGGPAHSLSTRPYYKSWLTHLLAKAKTNPSITITGFVSEANIPTYFAAADLVVLPYRGIMGASGVLTHALSYAKPFMVSEEMKGILSKDIEAFPLTSAGIQKMIATAKSAKKLSRLSMTASEIAQTRSIQQQVNHEYVTLYQTAHESTVSPSAKPSLAI
ncbi:glycosyltransferase [Candidatus Gottesmanbacteria bacterium]|nr:glycosyltransferase [Candidatus Gottesmanbacteria bacterium]